MFKGKELIGRKVMTLENGEHLDNVHDIIFDQSGNQVIAFLIDEGGWFHAAKVIPFASVRSVGEDALMVSSSADVMSARDDTQISDAISSKSGIVGLNLITSDGKELGRIADVFIDEASGQVVGYEATGGFFSDLSSGRTFVPVPESVIIGEKAAIVPPAVARAMEEQEPGGLQGALQRTGESLQTTAGSVSESVKTGAGNLADATRERQKAFVVGKTASREVVSDDGVVVARQNDVITAEQAEQAESLGLLGSLTAAATGGTVQAAYGSARESVQQGYGNLANASKERQKEYVVGRIAGSDVVASDGTTIVSQGQTISELHATIADDKGALGSLLGSATGGAVQTVYSAARERVGSLTGGSSLLGRRVMSDVYGPNRSFIAAQGQIVTEPVLARAQALGKEQELAAAVAGSPGPAGAGMQVAGERITEGAQNVRESASGLLERAKGWLSETRERVSDEAEERRIEGAIGRPVNRVVLDRQDSIILNIGEIITHKAVEQARASDVLGILLGSVSTETPVIDPLSVRPDETGRAALESQHTTADLNKPPNS